MHIFMIEYLNKKDYNLCIRWYVMKVKRIRKEIFIALLLVIVFLFTYIATKKDIFVKLMVKMLL